MSDDRQFKFGPDIRGQRFAHLVVMAPLAQTNRNGSRRWTCICDCGRSKVATTTLLRRGEITSCGCKRGTHRLTHSSASYLSWKAMRARCLSPNNSNYPFYGGRGIRICAEWDDFTTFLRDMGERPPTHTLDRIDPNGPYSPSNCRWATRAEQNVNKRATVHFEHDGKNLTLSEWALLSGVKKTTLQSRLKRGVPVSEALRVARALKDQDNE